MISLPSISYKREHYKCSNLKEARGALWSAVASSSRSSAETLKQCWRYYTSHYVAIVDKIHSVAIRGPRFSLLQTGKKEKEKKICIYLIFPFVFLLVLLDFIYSFILFLTTFTRHCFYMSSILYDSFYFFLLSLTLLEAPFMFQVKHLVHVLIFLM